MQITIEIELPSAGSLPGPSARRRARSRAGLTQDEIARLLRVTRPTVTRWEAGTIEPRGAARLLYSALLRRLAVEALPPLAPATRPQGGGAPPRSGPGPRA
jgi:transcriptional regulator with XRE-family HTH domain